MALVWDFARQIAEGSPGNTTSYYDEWTQAFYIKDDQIKTQVGLLSMGQWQNLDREDEFAVSDSGYGNLDIEHHFNGAVYGSAQHDADVVFFIYAYMMDVSSLLASGSWRLQADNPIKSGNVILKNVDSGLFSSNSSSLFLPGNRITMSFYAGDVGPYEVGRFTIEDSPFSDLDPEIRLTGRNAIGFYLSTQTFDENTDYQGTLTDVFTDILVNSGLASDGYLVQATATEGSFLFTPNNTMLDGLISALEIAGWYLDDQPSGRIVIGDADFIRDNAVSTGIHSFALGSEVFKRSMSRNMSGVYSRLCINRNGPTPRRVYAPVNYFDGWHLANHKTFYQNVPDDTSDADMDRLAADISDGIQYTGITEQFDGPIRPWLQIGDVTYVNDQARLAGIITEVSHEFGEDGFFTVFGVSSGGSISNPDNPETVASKYVGRMGGANRKRRLIDYLTGGSISGPAAGSSPVGAVAYQAAVSGGYMGAEQEFNEYLAQVAAGATVAAGGTIGQVYRKKSAGDYDAEWDDVSELPEGGTTGQVLKKLSDDDHDTFWDDDDVWGDM